MAIQFAKPKVPEGNPDELDKRDLVDAEIVLKVEKYDPQTQTKYGVSPTAKCHVVVVTGEYAGKSGPLFLAGNAGKQAGEALEEGEMAPARIVSGTGANGKPWFGVDWNADAEQVERAKAAVEQIASGGVPAVDPPF